MANIRNATLADAENITNIQISAVRNSFTHISKTILSGLSVEKRLARLKKQISLGEIELYVLDMEMGVVGFCQIGTTSYSPDLKYCGKIEKLYIHPDSQRQGFGNSLLEYGINKLRDKLFTEIALWVAVENSSAINFYTKRGFQDDGSRQIDTYTADGSSVPYPLKDWDDSKLLKPEEALEARYRKAMDSRQQNK
jgi:ribosomal protein S18 acetylase RimI-like enzyme